MWDTKFKIAEKEKLPQLASKLWNADEKSIKLIHAGMTFIYRFTNQGKGKYLRIIHPRLKSSSELMAAIDYQQYLFEVGAPISQPIKSKYGNFIEEILHDDEIFLAYVCNEVTGEVMHFDHKDESLYQTWGKSLAHLHRAAKSYHPPTSHPFLYWNDLWAEVGRNIQEENEVIQHEYATIDDWFNCLPNDTHDFGLTHGNHKTDNVICDGQHIQFIDFDEPVYHWFWADMARPFLELNNKKFHKWKEKALWFLDGYNIILPLEEEKINYLPWFIRMKNLEIYLWMKNNLGIDVGSREERLKELRENITSPLIEWNI